MRKVFTRDEVIKILRDRDEKRMRLLKELESELHYIFGVSSVKVHGDENNATHEISK